MQALNLTQETFNDKYLVYPYMLGNQTKTIEYLKDRVCQQV